MRNKLNGANVVLQVLKKLNIKDLFGYPGGAIIPIYNQLFDFDGINVFESAHEQGAVFAASSYAKVSKSTGCCLVTSGPGATNIVTGLYTAYMDSLPVYAVCGNVSSSVLNKDAFQECNILSITKSITKYQAQPKNLPDLVDNMIKAYFEANNGRKRPVLIDVCKDVQNLEISFSEFEQLYDQCFNKYEKEYENANSIDLDHNQSLKKMQQYLLQSKKLVVILGQGTAYMKNKSVLKSWLEKNNILFGETLLGLDIVDNEKNNLRMFGMHGSFRSNYALKHADLVISLGSRFADRITGDVNEFVKGKKIVHVDLDINEKDRNVKSDLFINANIDDVIEDISSLTFGDYSSFIKDVFEQKNYFPKDENDYNEFNVLKRISTQVKSSIVTTDVGQHQMFCAQSFDFTKHQLVTSGGAGTMGVGLPYGIGANIASNKPTISVVGDGGFLMSGNEMSMIKAYDLNVQVVLMNNSFLGMVRQWQEQFNDNRIVGTITSKKNPDFKAYVSAFGINYYCVTSMDDLNDVINNLDLNVSNVIECKFECSNNVLPIIPAGGSIDQIIYNDDY